MDSKLSKFWKLLFAVLILGMVTIWLSVFSTSENLKIVSCNVGQGDSTLIIHKSVEILIDGGPDNSVIDCLSKYIPFWDRTIEVVILTHPQSDHYTGLIAVMDRYKVGKILANSLNSGSQTYEMLKNRVLTRGVDVVNPTAGMFVRSGLIYLDILHPSKEFLAKNSSPNNLFISPFDNSSGVLGASDSSLDPNEFSIITLLTFGSFRFLFTGDAGSELLDSLATTLSENGINSINYIKIPHHGSKYSVSENIYDLMTTGIAVISVGKNSYGHPHGEVIKLLSDKAIKILRTDTDGDIVMETDGKRMWMEK